MKIINIALLLLLLALQYRLWAGAGSIPDVRRLERARAVQVDENRDLAERNVVLGAEVQDLKHGQAAVEERARSEMGMIKSDEIYYQIVGTEAPGGR